MKTQKIIVSAAFALLLTSSASLYAGLSVDCFDAGYDLYQLDSFGGRDFLTDSPSAIGDIVGVPGGDFLGVPVEGFPLEVFDFGDGNGAVSVGTADTIVRRTQVATESNSTVPIEIVALSLKSVEPVDLGGTLGTQDIFVTLGPSQPASQGSYNAIEFFGGSGGVNGAYQTQFIFNYEVRTGSPTGPVIPAGPFGPGGLDLLSDFSAAWSHLPQPAEFFDGPDRIIPGINSVLNGFDQSADFFLAADNSLRMSNFFFEGNTNLTFTHADAVPGEQPDAPILPGGTGDGGEFIFQDVDGGGNWFDPPLTGAYSFETTDGLSNFVTIGLPPFSVVPDADMSFEIVSSDGTVSVASGGFHTFGSPVDSFVIQGIDPLVDGGDPLAFPVFLIFDQSTVSFNMAPVPEPTSLALMLLGFVAVGRSVKRTSRQ